jgi:transmembrane sensor
LKWKSIVVRDALTPETLNALEARDAAALFIARRAEGLTTSEQQLLDTWLAKDEVNRRVFESADRAWQSFSETQGDEILAAMRAHALAQRPRTWQQWRPVAAVAVLFVVIGAALFVFRPGSQTAAPIQYASAHGEVKELQLPDGSSMTLDADSAAVGTFDAEGRTVELKRGRAFFAVMPDPSRPFAVTAADRRVIAVGTRFDVDIAADVLTVTLFEGHVRIETVDAAVASVTLEPGQKYVRRAGSATIQTIGAASENAASWRSGLINFNNQPLAEAAAVMNRYSLEQIVIHDPDVASIRLSGQFRAGDTSRFAETLAEVHRLKVVRREGEIELAK